MTESEMYEKSFERPTNYFKLTSQEQWDIDEKLGILDWVGGDLSPKKFKKFLKHYI